MTNLNELQTIVQSKKRFIDGYSKIILSFKPIQAYLLRVFDSYPLILELQNIHIAFT